MKTITKNLRDTFLKTIEKQNVSMDGTSVVIGFSGGPDSLCLFDLLLSLKDEKKLSLYPVHINHNLRGEKSDADQSFCEEFARTQGIECRTFSFDCREKAKDEGKTTEEAGREFRYDAFLKVADIAKEEHPDKDVVIAVAQNADDQAETILMRVLRGTGTDGLAGIPYVRKAVTSGGCDCLIVRPLLDVYKKDILEYLSERELSPRFDHTNEEPCYNRNKIRLELIPSLEEDYNPSVKDALLRLAQSADEDRRFLEEVAYMVYENALVKESCEEGVIRLDINNFRDGHSAIRRRVISCAVKAAGLIEDMASSHYNAVTELLFSDNPSASVDLPKGYSAWRVYDELRIGMKEGSPSEDKRPGKFLVEHMTPSEFQRNKGEANTYAAFDEDLLKAEFGENALENLVLRDRLPGDEIALSIGSKKIQDLLVDMKVPKDDRKNTRVLAIGHNVLGVYFEGMDIKPRYTSKCKITDETEEIAYIVLFV